MNKLLPEDRLEACKTFFVRFRRLPKTKETIMFKNVEFKIGMFISNVKRGYYNNDIQQEIMKIFKLDTLKTRVVERISDVDKIEMCWKYKNKFNKLPSYNDIITLPDGRVFKIGIFISNVKRGSYNYLKPSIDEIFS